MIFGAKKSGAAHFHPLFFGIWAKAIYVLICCTLKYIYKRVEEGSVMPLLRSTWEKVVQAQR